MECRVEGFGTSSNKVEVVSALCDLVRLSRVWGFF